MKALFINQKASDIDGIHLEQVSKDIPLLQDQECLIKVAASGINQSDALAVTGYFSHAVWPRIPGRDYAGTVVEGPTQWLGKKVWGTGGASGISFDGTQAEYIKLKPNELSEIPRNLDVISAGAQALPYVTAYYSLVTRAHLKENEVVLITGALGQVGSAAMAICLWKKCKPIALVRGEAAVTKARQFGWTVIDSDCENLAEALLKASDGKPIDVILNGLGNLYWPIFINSLANFGRIVTIGARERVREVTVNLFTQYRANQDIIGINSVALDFAANAKLLDELKIGFEEGELKPLLKEEMAIFPFDEATRAYQEVLRGTLNKRVVIQIAEEN